MTWPQRIALTLYGWLMHALVPLLLYKLRRRGRDEPLYLQRIGQRLGRYDDAPQPAAWFWVHAVSLGETRAAGLLIEQLRAARPDIRILLTHGTATGWAQGQALLRPGDAQAWLPWDTPRATGRFLDHFRPQVGVLLETEVWPHLVHQCARRGIPLCLVNARMNEQSMRRALRLAWLAGPAYAALAAIHAQSAQDARRLKMVGARVDGVWGNLKFDVSPDTLQRAAARRWRDAMASQGPLVMLASSREGEEQLWLQAWQALRDRAPHLRWLIVPRHPQRFDAVHRLLADAGLHAVRRIDWDDAHDAAGLSAAARSARIWLGDSVGEMQLYYSLCDLALLGGSFLPLGGLRASQPPGRRPALR
ncbi:MAG: 3-deoxy-D-manno-octulosonic acid transferase [Betaproteobacteria bacterium]|nr:3-deoxy-D-manno-octulosonic acid transferase [Betaproteobacteria bacterium]